MFTVLIELITKFNEINGLMIHLLPNDFNLFCYFNNKTAKA